MIEHVLNNRIYLLRLKKFQFNIRSHLLLNDQISLSSNEDCQLSFKDFKDNKVISCVDYFSHRKQGQCHMYSYPYQATWYQSITNHFPGGLFKCVRKVSLYDEHPFEHEFFLKIKKSFPFMSKLTVNNDKPQKNKFDDNRHLSIIEYSYLTHLDLSLAHQDYVEQFLLDTKTWFPRRLKLEVDYQSINKVTLNFTRNQTRINCTNFIYLDVPSQIPITQQLKDYFPYMRIYFLN